MNREPPVRAATRPGGVMAVAAFVALSLHALLVAALLWMPVRLPASDERLPVIDVVIALEAPEEPDAPTGAQGAPNLSVPSGAAAAAEPAREASAAPEPPPPLEPPPEPEPQAVATPVAPPRPPPKPKPPERVQRPPSSPKPSPAKERPASATVPRPEAPPAPVPQAAEAVETAGAGAAPSAAVLETPHGTSHRGSGEAAADAATAKAAHADYAASLLAWLHRYKRYPAAAQAGGIEGRVMLRLTLDRNGRVLHATADDDAPPELVEATLAMVRRADPMPPFPASLPGQRRDFRIPVEFALSTARRR